MNGYVCKNACPFILFFIKMFKQIYELRNEKIYIFEN